MKTPLKIAFLFGAGAEAGPENFDQLTGGNYFNDTVLSPDEAIFDALKNKFQGTYFGSCKYSKHKIYIKKQSERNVLLDMLRLHLEKQYYSHEQNDHEKYVDDFIATASLMPEHYSKSLRSDLAIENDDANRRIKEAIAKNGDKDEWAQRFEPIIEEFYRVLSGKPSTINHILIKMLTREISDEEGESSYGFLYNITSSGFFEQYFHTIVDPSKYSRIKFMKIFNYYWSCYFAMIGAILDMIKPVLGQYGEESDRKLMEKIVGETSEKGEEKKEGKNPYNYQAILENMQHFTKILYSEETFKMIAAKGKDSYYQRIKTALEQDKTVECSGVLTSNYYRYVELLGKDVHVAYLNGELKYFEFPEILTISDFGEGRYDSQLNEKLFFPFILGQSMLKPIIDSKQIHSFQKAIDILNGSDVLVILGYNINEDDNHINAILREFVTAKRNRKIIVMGKGETKETMRRLRLADEEQIVSLHYDYKKIPPDEAINLLFEKLREENR